MIKFKKRKKLKNSEPTFEMLCRGDCFIFGNDVFMKTTPLEDENDERYNAVRLSDGDTYWGFDTEEIITPVVLKAKVKRRLS